MRGLNVFRMYLDCKGLSLWKVTFGNPISWQLGHKKSNGMIQHFLAFIIHSHKHKWSDKVQSSTAGNVFFFFCYQTVNTAQFPSPPLSSPSAHSDQFSIDSWGLNIALRFRRRHQKNGYLFIDLFICILFLFSQRLFLKKKTKQKKYIYKLIRHSILSKHLK